MNPSIVKEPNDPVIVSGVRTPFIRSNGLFVDMAPYDLGRIAIAGLMAHTGIDPNLIEHVTMGTVIHDPNTPNVARESMLAAGLSPKIPAHTVSLACISSNMAGTGLADMIKLGRIEVSIFGGTDTCSDPPIRVSRKMRKTLVRLGEMKSMGDIVKQWPLLRTLRPGDFALDVPKVVEFSNGKSMGEGCEILAQYAGVSRKESDEFAFRSHQLAVKAQDTGFFDEFLVPVHVPPKFTPVTKDNGPRGDTTLERLAKLKPAFDKKFGISTAGSSSFLTDGASAVLLMSRKKAHEVGFTPKAAIRDYVFRAGDALNEMLSGPALTIPVLLKKNNLKARDIGVWEIHEAFAAQVVANMKLINSPSFLSQRLKIEESFGEIPLEKVNIWGGSLSIGHPFGATGGRLLATAAHRLQQEGQRYAIVSGCAAGGHGSAILLENANG